MRNIYYSVSGMYVARSRIYFGHVVHISDVIH